MLKMADGLGSSERQMLGQFAKSQTKYGTTTIPVRWNSNFVKHKVVSTDSLVGIALKYGVSLGVTSVYVQTVAPVYFMLLMALQITMMELNSKKRHHRISRSIIDAETSPDNKEYFKHYVTLSDSTFSLALKYGITVEQLKRENKLWSNDALFLREYLLVPLTKENSQCIPENSEIVRATSLKSENDSIRTPTSSDSSCPSCDGEKATSTSEPDLSAKDFLNKYDSNIAQLKSNVQKMEESTSLQDISLSAQKSPLRESCGHNSSRRHKPASMNSMSKSISFGNDCSPPVLVIRSRTKQVQSTLQKSEQTNNELFQL